MKYQINPELLTRYVLNMCTLEEIAVVSLAIKKDEEIRQTVSLLEEINDRGQLRCEDGDVPMASSAAASEGNLCDVMCEEYILKSYLGERTLTLEDYTEEALDNYWLRDEGTPLHSMGHLLEKYGMRVSRSYDCTAESLQKALERRDRTILVVDYGQLTTNEPDGIFHAVVCICLEGKMIRIYDPAIKGHSYYPVESFTKAWSYSRFYMVSASADKLEYIPHPIDVSDVDLDDSLLDLSEAIAENAHEIWAHKRSEEGWTFGPERNDSLKQTPDMVPYDELLESEKMYDRDVSLNTICLVKKLGFSIHKRYTRFCPQCGEYVSNSMHFCPNCGRALPELDGEYGK